MVSAPGRRRQVAHARKAWKLSLRRACALLEVPRSSANYESKRAIADAPAVGKMRELAAQYPRYGYRMIRGLLATKGIAMSADRAHRLWRGAGLQVPRRRPRRRVAANRPRPVPPSAPNHVWAIDFVHDTRAIDVGAGLRASRVVEVLSRLVSLHGAPRYIRSDNGPEFISKALMTWRNDESIESAFIDPGKPWQNGTNESFNGRFREECLSLEWFRSRIEAKAVIETWRRHYNDVRPHSSLGGRTPNEFKRDLGIQRATPRLATP